MHHSIHTPSSSLLIAPICAFDDNYIWCLYNPTTQMAVVVDPGESAPVLDFLSTHHLTLQAILITHHHFDHTDGVAQLLSKFTSALVYAPENGPFKQAHHFLKEADTINIFDITFSIMQVPGHTLDHIAYYSQEAEILFCGDTLFLAGCGRVFEGTMKQMHHSLERLTDLPDETIVFPTHEYSLANLAFAKQVEPDNAAIKATIAKCQLQRQAQQPTLPTSILLEKTINPFLRCHEPTVKQAALTYDPQTLHTPAEVFTVLRKWKNHT